MTCIIVYAAPGVQVPRTGICSGVIWFFRSILTWPNLSGAYKPQDRMICGNWMLKQYLALVRVLPGNGTLSGPSTKSIAVKMDSANLPYQSDISTVFPQCVKTVFRTAATIPTLPAYFQRCWRSRKGRHQGSKCLQLPFQNIGYETVYANQVNKMTVHSDCKDCVKEECTCEHGILAGSVRLSARNWTKRVLSTVPNKILWLKAQFKTPYASEA